LGLLEIWHQLGQSEPFLLFFLLLSTIAKMQKCNSLQFFNDLCGDAHDKENREMAKLQERPLLAVLRRCLHCNAERS
jgi:hypothetical protein